MSAWRPPQGGRQFTRPALEQWLGSPRGRELLTLEQRELGRVLPEVFGRHVLQIGSWGRGHELLEGAETLHQAVLGTVGDFGATALSETERLPIAAKTVDAVVLPHTLEFTHTPHNLLREANRILTDRGRLFVVGFNPWGVWGLRQRLGLRSRAFPAGARFYSVGRLCDWLELLDLEVTEVRRFGVGFPWNAPRSDGEPWSLASLTRPFAETYLLSAKKRVLPMNFVGRVQRAQVRQLVGVASPAARRGESLQSRNEAPSDPAPAA
ncbi:methyltransferase family protein [Panacagrimonas perspica]|uniref:Methyltransferase family protein n=1 Tax=Panacagrimonas perspica TaxID=381431 RepID=A0A4R7P9P5_9GAMM|nr:methyltransferase domain-containing protein [Panacagrimonas perspica]TDU30725.1 methyltransferase family protein [Panacagrimonas perspica]THD01550.1 SAM-dependent methyltransferase [Panacagrimonas perspica]